MKNFKKEINKLTKACILTICLMTEQIDSSWGELCAIYKKDRELFDVYSLYDDSSIKFFRKPSKSYKTKPRLKWYKRKKFFDRHIHYPNYLRAFLNMGHRVGWFFRQKFLKKSANVYRTYFKANRLTLRGSYQYVSWYRWKESKVRYRLRRKAKDAFRLYNKLAMYALSKLSREFFRPVTKYVKAYNIKNDQQLWIKYTLSGVETKDELRKISHPVRVLKARKKKPKKRVSKISRPVLNYWRLRSIKFNFFKTTIGMKFLRAHIKSVRAKKRKQKKRKVISVLIKQKSRRENRAWFYTNAYYPKDLPFYYNKKLMRKEYPFNIFKIHWTRRNWMSWARKLCTNRLLYNGLLQTERAECKWKQDFIWHPFLRHRRPFQQKRTWVYQKLIYSLRRREHTGYYTDKRKQLKRKLLLRKTILPFYGHLKRKQFVKLSKKARGIKSEYISTEDLHLGYVERRLDVLVYRMNFAPTIFWARRLIEDGLVFVKSNYIDTYKEFERMYANHKQNVYPLKLRDPKQLYKKQTLTLMFDNNKTYKGGRYKFLLEPIRKIHHLTQVGDIIFCAASSTLNSYKAQNTFFKKPIPDFILSYSKTTQSRHSLQATRHELYNRALKWDNKPMMGMLLFAPHFDAYGDEDRASKSFFRWISL